MRACAPLVLLLALALPACGPPPAPPQSEVSLAPPAVPEPAPEPAPVATAAPAPEPPQPAPKPGFTFDPAIEPMRDIADAPELARAATLLGKSQPAAARKELASVIAALGADGAPDLIIAAHTLAARACVRLKDDKCVNAEGTAATALWSRPDTWSRVMALGEGDAAKQTRLGRALSAAGEAYYLLAEQKRAEAERITLPVYRGSGERDEVLAFVNGKVVEWVRKKRVAVDEAAGQYRRIVDMHPTPPRWMVAAGARVGAMWSSFVDDFRYRIPLPAAWKRDGEVPGTGGALTYAELRREFALKLEEASEPQLVQARAAFTKCSEWARKYQIPGDDAKACDTWLAAHPAKP